MLNANKNAGRTLQQYTKVHAATSESGDEATSRTARCLAFGLSLRRTAAQTSAIARRTSAWHRGRGAQILCQVAWMTSGSSCETSKCLNRAVRAVRSAVSAAGPVFGLRAATIPSKRRAYADKSVVRRSLSNGGSKL